MGGLVNEERFASLNVAQWFWHFYHLEEDRKNREKEIQAWVLLVLGTLEPERAQVLKKEIDQIESDKKSITMEGVLGILDEQRQRAAKAKEEGGVASEGFREKLASMRQRIRDRDSDDGLDIIEGPEDIIGGDDGREPRPE